MDLYAEFDRSNFPLIIINFTGKSETNGNFQIYLDELGENYKRKEKFSLVFELTKAPIPKVSFQLKQANWMKENEPNIVKYCQGCAYIIPGLVMRNILKFIFSIQKNPVQFKVFSTIEEGKTWVLQLNT